MDSQKPKISHFLDEEMVCVFTEWNPNPIIEIDDQLNILYTNDAALLKFHDLLTLKQRHPLLKEIELIIPELIFHKESEITVLEREFELENTFFEMQIYAIPKTAHIYLFLTDMTRRIKAEHEKKIVEKQLFQAQKMEAIGHLTSGLAHDFNNILTAIQGNLQMLKRELQREEAKVLKRISAALHATERASNLSKRLLAFSRKDQLQPSVVDLNVFIADISNLMGPTLGIGIHLEKKIEAEVWKIYVDPIQLESVLLNLAVNARDAMPDGGTVVIHVANATIRENIKDNNNDSIMMRPGDYVKVSITDNGMGIPKEVIPQIFEPLFTTKDIGKGTGLGLSQVYAFMVHSQGQVVVESEEGKGTTFHLYFPRIDTSILPTR